MRVILGWIAFVVLLVLMVACGHFMVVGPSTKPADPIELQREMEDNIQRQREPLIPDEPQPYHWQAGPIA